jgi:hypothetical protein
MGMADPIPTYSYIISELVKRHTELAYIHMIEPGIESNADVPVEVLANGTMVSHKLTFRYNALTTPNKPSHPMTLHTNCGLPARILLLGGILLNQRWRHLRNERTLGS